MDFGKLNKSQIEAVTTTEGPVLVLAGAGSGKTSVLTSRIAYLVNEKGVSPYNILAITFTNKAAGEMKERVTKLIDEDMRFLAIGTFHSLCARFLRYDAERLGYTSNFTIYDSDDTLTLLKRIMRDGEPYYDGIKPQMARQIISRIKNSTSPYDPSSLDNMGPHLNDRLRTLFERYNQRLKEENAMDFDDLLLNMNLLLQENEDILERYQQRFRYILVDEYQDTNHAQYELVKLLAGKHGNIFVVGDDDQSIYGWRGARVENIFSFDHDFPGTKVIKLEQNYRSHQKILDCANSVIQKADFRRDKKCFSLTRKGPQPVFFIANTEYDEAEFIASKVESLSMEGIPYREIAVLYRTHMQARPLEEKFRMHGIPYQVYGGISFYQRKEVKDMIAYATLLVNPSSDVAFTRIINEPKRGIGPTTVAKIASYARENNMSMFEAAGYIEKIASSSAAKVRAFTDLMKGIQEKLSEERPSEILNRIYIDTGYRQSLKDEDIMDETRIENVESLIAGAETYEEDNDEATLQEFLEMTSLISDTDSMSEEGGVVLMTLHSSKGLEFDTVFLSGMEEGLFPSEMSVGEGRLDEERRLCYVGITRAKRNLYLSMSNTRVFYGRGTRDETVSRFVEDIPQEMIQKQGLNRRKHINTSYTYEPDDDFADFFAIGKKKKDIKEVKREYIFTRPEEFKSKATHSPSDFAEGQKVRHKTFGEGTIKSIQGADDRRVATVQFASGEKKMFLAYAPLEII